MHWQEAEESSERDTKIETRKRKKLIFCKASLLTVSAFPLTCPVADVVVIPAAVAEVDAARVALAGDVVRVSV